jgi:hypothetical protein
MGDPTVQGFSLTPDEEKFFARFLRRRAIPLSATVSALAGGLSALLLSCALAPSAGAPSASASGLDELPELARPLADEQARAELVLLRKELAELRERPAAASSPGADAHESSAEIAELRRALESQKRELQILATSLSSLEDRPADALPASIDGAAPAELEPLRKRVHHVESRQDREEASRLEWAGNVEQRVRNLELARKNRESDQQVALQAILDRLHALETAQTR